MNIYKIGIYIILSQLWWFSFARADGKFSCAVALGYIALSNTAHDIAVFEQLVAQYQADSSRENAVRLQLRARQMGWSLDLHSDVARLNTHDEWLPSHLTLSTLVEIFKLVEEAGWAATSEKDRENIWAQIQKFERAHNIWVDRNSTWFNFKVQSQIVAKYPLAKDNSLLGDLAPVSRVWIPDDSETIVLNTIDTTLELAGEDLERARRVDQIRMGREIIRDTVTGLKSTREMGVSLYLLSGSDGSLGRQLFPQSPVSIGVDQLPFRQPFKLNDPLIFKTLEVSQYDRIASVERQSDQGLGSAILGRFKAVLPHFRVRKAVLFSTPGRPMSNNFHEGEIHALIEYDSGAGTPIYCHLQYQTKLKFGRGLNDEWWFKIINEANPKGSLGLISKASMWLYLNDKILRKDLINYLRWRGGVIVEDDTSAPSFSGPETLGPLKMTLSDVSFGYSGTAHVTLIPGSHPNPNPNPSPNSNPSSTPNPTLEARLQTRTCTQF